MKRSSPTRTRYTWAAILMIVHGAVMEFGVFLALGPLLATNVDRDTIGRYFHFIVPYLQENLFLMMGMSGVFGVVRVIGAIGVLRNRLWGLALSVINCVVTMGLMVFMLPAGIIDGLLACSALILLLTAYFGTRSLDSAQAGADAPGHDAGR
jgi:uncharacterized membrane protein (DUF2068 family)